MIEQIVSRKYEAGQEEGLLAHIEKVISSSEYKSETESNAGSVLLAQELPLPTPSLFLLSPPLSTPIILPPPYTMSHYDTNLYVIIRQQQEQLTALQAQI